MCQKNIKFFCIFSREPSEKNKQQNILQALLAKNTRSSRGIYVFGDESSGCWLRQPRNYRLWIRKKTTNVQICVSFSERFMPNFWAESKGTFCCLPFLSIYNTYCLLSLSIQTIGLFAWLYLYHTIVNLSKLLKNPFRAAKSYPVWNTIFQHQT